MTEASPKPTFAGTERFRPLGVLGHGRAGIVYRVQDRETESEVALKALAHVAPESQVELKREFRALAGVTHPGLVALYELFVHGDGCFFTMELVEGTDFARCFGDAAMRPLEEGGLARLVDGSVQLVAALAAVHAAGKLHRDVKPSNVLVTPAGRVVVLDFGLVAAMHVAAGGDLASFSGTLAYAAPEQILGGPRLPAADWYGVGTILYETLTGRLPFEGTLAQLIVAKSEGRPARPGRLRAGVPASLDALVLDLLHPDPTRRPDAGEIEARLRAALGPHVLRAGEAAPASRMAVEWPLVGRETELARLGDLLRNLGAGGACIALIEGPSGIGKTELVRRFLAEAERDGDVLVWRGRCQPQEIVAYNAFDDVIDSLSEWIGAAPEAEIGAALAHGGRALARLFPVLARGPDAADDAALEPFELRRLGFEALRRLLAAVAAERDVVLWIDDAQWGDQDSAALLAEIVRAPDPPRLLLVMSARTGGEWEGQGPLLGALGEGMRVERFLLGPLDSAAAADLATRLWRAAGAAGEPRPELVAEAGGSPFMIGQLAFAAPHGDDPARRLSDVLAERLGGLSSEARDLLEVVAIAGAPVSRQVALEAAGVGRRGRPLAYRLQGERLLRPAVLREEAGIEVYHDRIREEIVAAIPGGRRQALHLRLAHTIAATESPDATVLFTHYCGAGDNERAARFGEEAGDRAAEILAFERAAELYGQVLQLTAGRADLIVKRAQALANAGRSTDAALAFQAAADRLGGAIAESEEILDLRRRAAEQFLRAGRVIEGTEGTRAVLAHAGIPFARSPGRALVAALGLRARLAWRGHAFRASKEPIERRARLRLETLWGATVTLSVMDQVQADALGVRHFLEAFDLGDPVHAARAIGLEIAKAVQFGGPYQRRRVARMLPRMEDLVRLGGEPYERSYLETVTGVCAYQSGRWQEAYEHIERGLAITRENMRGASWEIATGESFALSSLAHMGEMRAMSERLATAIRDAEDRGDLYASVGFRAGILNLAWLARNRPDEARRHADESIERWPATGSFNVQHYLHLIASVHIDLYVGDPWAAWARLESAWPQARKALFLLMEMPRVELRFLRARAAVACASLPEPLATGAGRGAWTRDRLLDEAERIAKRIERDRGVVSTGPIAALVRGGVARARGRLDEARAHLAASRDGFERIDMGLHAAAARWAGGDLVGGDEGRRAREVALAWLGERGVVEPRPFATVAAGAL